MAAFINAATTRAVVRSLGMVAENEIRRCREEHPVYGESDFLRVIEEEGIGHNNVVSYFQASECQSDRVRIWTVIGTGADMEGLGNVDAT